MTDNPFAKKAGGEGAPASDATPAPDAAAAAAASEWDAAPDPEVAAEPEADPSFGTFEEPQPDKSKPQTVPYTRLAKVIGERNTYRGELTEAQQSLARVTGKLEAVQAAQAVLAEKYRGNADLIAFDHDFMATMDSLAKTDPAVAAAAQAVKAALKKGASLSEPTTPTTTPAAQAAQPTVDPNVAALLERDARSRITTALGAVKDHYAEAAARDILANVELSDLANATPAQIVEMAKVYFAETKTPSTEFLKAKPAGEKPATKGSARPAQTVAASESGEESGEPRPQFKSRDELDAFRNKRFAKLASEVLG